MKQRRDYIAVPDLMAYLLETPQSPTHIGALQIFEPQGATRATNLARRLVKAFRASEVDPLFARVPSMPRFGRAHWVPWKDYDPYYHVRQMAVPAPGDNRSLLQLVETLHTGMMDRDYPGFMVYVIEGLQDNRLALYWKIHHAYIDGGGLLLRMSAMMTEKPAARQSPLPLWAELPELPVDGDGDQPARPAGGSKVRAAGKVVWEISGLVGQSVLRTGGVGSSESPLPFSAPNSFFNSPLHAARRLGEGSLPLPALKSIASERGVTINEIALTLAGAALERYASERGETLEKPLVAGCPMAVRREGDSAAGNQIVALTVKLGQPGVAIEERLQQVHASSADAKAEAGAVSREALMGFQMMVGGVSELAGKTPWGGKVPPLTNVNISNLAGPRRSFYLAGARLVQTIPVSALAGSVLNITFGSLDDRLDFAIISDAAVVPDAQRLADYIAEAFKELSPPPRTRAGAGRGGRRARGGES